MIGKLFNAINPLNKPGQAVNAFGSLVKGDIGGALKNAAPLIPGPAGQLASTLLGGQGGNGVPGAAASLLGNFDGKAGSAPSLLGNLGNLGLGGNPASINGLLSQSQQRPGDAGDLARTLLAALQSGQIGEKDLLPLLKALAGQPGAKAEAGGSNTGVFAEDEDGPETSSRPLLA